MANTQPIGLWPNLVATDSWTATHPLMWAQVRMPFGAGEALASAICSMSLQDCKNQRQAQPLPHRNNLETHDTKHFRQHPGCGGRRVHGRLAWSDVLLDFHGDLGMGSSWVWVLYADAGCSGHVLESPQ